MKKFFLYLVLIIFVAGLVTLAYGFWNARNIRSWASAVGELKARHNISEKQKTIEGKMNATGGRTAAQFSEDLTGFVKELKDISAELKSAAEETEKMSAPRGARSVSFELSDFYRKSQVQVSNVAKVAEYMNRVFEVTSVFDKMNPGATPDDIRNMIAEAKTKSADIDTNILPSEMTNAGNDLKVVTENYLDQFEQFASGKVEATDALNSSYNEFSTKVNDFLSKKKGYFDSLENLDTVGKNIDADLSVLENIKFSIK